MFVSITSITLSLWLSMCTVSTIHSASSPLPLLLCLLSPASLPFSSPFFIQEIQRQCLPSLVLSSCLVCLVSFVSSPCFVLSRGLTAQSRPAPDPLPLPLPLPHAHNSYSLCSFSSTLSRSFFLGVAIIVCSEDSCIYYMLCFTRNVYFGFLFHFIVKFPLILYISIVSLV